MVSAVDSAIQDASKAIDTSGLGAQTADALQLGMSLAQRQQQVEQARQSMEFQKQQMDMHKHDWMHEQIKSAASENDPKLRGVLLDNLDEQFPKLFDGKRINPATMELLKKSPSFIEKVAATTRVRNAMRSGNFDQLPDFDEQVVNGMTSSDISTQLGHLNTIQQQETAITKALTNAKVATPQAAAAAGTSQEELQKTLTQSSPTKIRASTAENNIINSISRIPEIKNTRQAQFQVEKGLDILSKPAKDIKWIDFSEANLDFAALLTQGSSVVPEGRRQEVDWSPTVKKTLDKWRSNVDNKETGGPSQAEIELVKNRFNRLKKVTEDVHDMALKREIETRRHALEGVGANPDDLLEKQKMSNWVHSGGTPSPAENVAPAPPKVTQQDMEQTKQKAMEYLRQARASQKAGTSYKWTEQQIKEAYKNRTGKDLVE